MPSMKAQQEIERKMCKETKFATYFELRLDKNRKLLLDEFKKKGCYDEQAEMRRK